MMTSNNNDLSHMSSTAGSPNDDDGDYDVLDEEDNDDNASSSSSSLSQNGDEVGVGVTAVGVGGVSVSDDDDNDNDNESIGMVSSADLASVDTGTSPSSYNPDTTTTTSSHTMMTTAFSSSSKRGRRARGDGGGDLDNDAESTVSIARQENNAVMKWRLIMFAVLVLSMVGVALGVFWYVDSGERSEFRTQFEDDSFKTFEALGNSLDLKLGAIDAFVVSLVSYAAHQNGQTNVGQEVNTPGAGANVGNVNMTATTTTTTTTSSSPWPFVQIPDHAVRASKVRSLTNAINIEQYQIVKEETTGTDDDDGQRKAWEEFSSKQGESWVVDALRVQTVDQTFQGLDLTTTVGERSQHIQTNVSTIHQLDPSTGIYVTVPYHDDDDDDDAAAVAGPGGGMMEMETMNWYAPTWQSYPIVGGTNANTALPYNVDQLRDPKMGPEVLSAIKNGRPVITRVLNLVDPNDPTNSSQRSVDATNAWAEQFFVSQRADTTTTTTNGDDEDEDAKTRKKDHTEPLVRFLFPVLENAATTVSIPTTTTEATTTTTTIAGSSPSSNTNNNVVSVVATTFYWSTFLKDILPAGEIGLVVVFENTCNQSFTFQLNGPDVVYLGEGDLHDRRYDGESGEGWDMAIESSINDLSAFTTGERFYSGLPLSDDGLCMYTVTTYASRTMENESRTSDPIVFTIIAVLIFAFTSIVFIAYDKLVAIRQYKVMKSAVRSAAIVSSLFPSSVRDRLYNNGDDDSFSNHNNNTTTVQPNKLRLKSFLSNEGTSSTEDPSCSQGAGADVLIPGVSQFSKGKPIADLFTDCTVFFCDIAGFTAWSSARQPGQVFMLLETIYGAFDAIAARRGVFKVETIGDSYLCVTGLPEPRKDHAIVMAKFARDCLKKFHVICDQLETFLGPDTGDLGLRIGFHSGPLTAGVLRNQRARFQLFGDTVNTAARMESTGCVNRIQCSETTASLLPDHWVTPREDKVEAKGKGSMQTFWVEPRSRKSSRSTSDILGESVAQVVTSSNIADTKTERLVRWNVDVLARLLHKILVRRNTLRSMHGKSVAGDDRNAWNNESWTSTVPVLDEVQEAIELPAFEDTAAIRRASNDNYGAVAIGEKVLSQLRDLVFEISQTYHKNPFHSFEHASHITMSVVKLMSRIVAPDVEFINENQLHDHTYGITSDPLTQFAVTFAALIHDADHNGVSNDILVKEGAEIATIYKGKSVAEQNSVNLCWRLLMKEKFVDLRNAICASREEVVRFRQLVVNAVMATDIMDKDLKRLRDERWNRAFSTDDERPAEPHTITINRKATIVIEHLIQASDVSHTMQHWHLYKKWNQRLFMEMKKAFNEGRSKKDPATFWYQGEIGFFDFYIIPLAKKLSDCGVFGVSSDEYLNYAIQNRNEWEKKGKAIVEEYISASSQNGQ